MLKNDYHGDIKESLELLLIKFPELNTKWGNLPDLYQTRYDYFFTQAHKTTDRAIMFGYISCAVSLNVCLMGFLDFEVAIRVGVDKLENDLIQDLAEKGDNPYVSIRKLKELLLEDVTIEKLKLEEQYQSSINFRQMINQKLYRDFRQVIDQKMDGVFAVIELKKSINAYLVRNLTTSIIGSFLRLLKTEDLISIEEVLFLQLKTIIGLMPLTRGAGYFAVALYNSVTKQAMKCRTEKNLLYQFCNYSEVLFQWCVITHLLGELSQGKFINFGQNIDDLDLKSAEDEIKRISEMIRGRIENINKTVYYGL